MRPKIRTVFLLAGIIISAAVSAPAQERWPSEKASEWQAQHRWLVGCNFAPSTAINQLEMWQPTRLIR